MCISDEKLPSELRYSSSIKYILDFEDRTKIYKISNLQFFFRLYIEMIAFWI